MQFLIAHKSLILRLGLAFVFFYAGIGSLLNPEAWVGFIPSWVEIFIPANTFLLIHAGLEIILAIFIVFNLFPKITYALSSLFLLGILVFYGIDEITFRDLGLFILSIFLWLVAMERKEENI